MIPRPSRLAVHFRCPGSLSLEAVERSSAAGDAGSKRHRWLAQHPEIARQQLGLVGPIFAEEKLHIGEMEGTADVVCTGLPVTIVDYKTSGEDKGNPKDSPQLMAYALATGAERVAFVYVADSGPDGECRATWSRMETVTPDELHAFGQSLNELLDGPHDHFVTGSHCSHCPGATSCSALRSEVSLALTDQALVLDQHTAAAAWSRLKAVRSACDIAEAAVKAYATENPVTLENGKVLGATQVSREEILADRAVALLPELKQVAERRLTKASVLSVVGDAGLVKLRLGGATRTQISTSVREFKP